jgi:hypothetical protein
MTSPSDQPTPQPPPTPPPPPPQYGGPPSGPSGQTQPGYGRPPQPADGQQGYVPYPQQGDGQQPSAQYPPQAPPGYAGQPMPGIPGYAQHAQPVGPTGRLRPTGMIILLFFVTLGIWGFVYYYQTQEEMKRHSGEGLGGLLALVISIVFGIVSPFFLSHEVGQLYARRGHEPPVTALTALWFFPGIFILVGPFIWFIRSNNALNEYWASLGVRETTVV